MACGGAGLAVERRAMSDPAPLAMERGIARSMALDLCSLTAHGVGSGRRWAEASGDHAFAV